ncbi:hypothetical protein TNCV_3400591 [Trichonephila clavipes]|nr:hypothetical protein TNCV_3400591 [Trichonephila clavipes]
MFKIATIGMHVRTIPKRYAMADLFENTERFTDHSSNGGYSCHQVHFRTDERVVQKTLHRTPEKKNQRR